MPWGKHKGTVLADVPADYLRWVLRRPPVAVDEARRRSEYLYDPRRDDEDLREMVRRALDARGQ